jgi:hypothetical protein
MRSVFLPFIVLLTSFASGQTVQEPYTFNCNTLQSPSDGCKSYNEMILKRDQQLMQFLENEKDVYACFRPNEDVFLFMTFRTPGDSQFKMGKSGYLEAKGQIVYFRYSDGNLEDSKIGDGTWTKYIVKGGPIFFTPQGSELKASISDSDFSISYTFPNLSRKLTTYEVSVRRSTLRFSEHYTFPQTPVASKKTQVPPPERDDRLSYTGYCAKIKPSSYLFYPASNQ